MSAAKERQTCHVRVPSLASIDNIYARKIAVESHKMPYRAGL